MKLLSIVVPCYNSMAYMRKCVESLLLGGDDVEILIVNDGSADDTGRIADTCQAEYPGIVRAIHQPNAGHGGAVNTGLRYAKGLYLKVVDSDDWVNAGAYREILDALASLCRDGRYVDLLISNFVYEKAGHKRKKVMRYHTALREREVLTWDDVGRLSVGQYILMHSLIYRTGLLRECGLNLPEHTFYVDNLFAYQPLPHVKSLYYLDVDFYRYLIGHEGQSVRENTMIRQIEQQIRVNQFMLESVDLNTLSNRRQRDYLRGYLEIVTAVSSMLLILAGTPKHMAMKRELWMHIKGKDAKLYTSLRHRMMGTILHMPSPVPKMVYSIVKRFYQFN